jgi:hypothetical protein
MIIEKRPRPTPAKILLFLIALLYPINYRLALNLRIADFLILLLVFASAPYLRVRDMHVFTLAIVFFILYAVSVLYGIFTVGIVTSTNFVFVYKYLIAFVLFWVIASLPLEPRELQSLQRLLFFVFFLLIAWVFAYILLRAQKILSGNYRVSFPFSSSDDPRLSDSPLYSVVLSTCLVAYLFAPRRRTATSMIKACAVTGVTGLAIILSASRTGLVSMVGTFVIYGMRRIYRDMIRGRIRFKRYTIWISLIMIIAGAIIMVWASGITDKTLLPLLSRAISFRTDESVNSRFGKALYAIQDVFGGPILIGIGSQSTFHVWFDSTWVNVLYNTGAAGVLVFILLLVLFLRNCKARALASGTSGAYEGLEYLFINYSISSISLEPFLVTRGLVPFVFFSAIFLRRIDLGQESTPLAMADGRMLRMSGWDPSGVSSD